MGSCERESECRLRYESTHTHMDVPWRVGHDDVEFAKDGVIEFAHIAVDPLRRLLKGKERSSSSETIEKMVVEGTHQRLTDLARGSHSNI